MKTKRFHDSTLTTISKLQTSLTIYTNVVEMRKGGKLTKEIRAASVLF